MLAFLDQILADVIEAGEQLREQPQEDADEPSGFTGSLSLIRYQVNLLVAHGKDDHAPVHACDNPTYANLVGRVDQVPHMGTLLTNFTLVQPGALQRANGGYLMLDALQVLAQPYAWEGLKRALTTGEVTIDSLQIAGDPDRVREWLGLPANYTSSVIDFEFVSPHGTPGLMAVTFETPRGEVTI